VTCTEALDLLPAAIDGQIGDDLRHQLRRHLSECSHCLHEFELEQMTKNIVRKHYRPTPSPEHLRERIVTIVKNERAAKALHPAHRRFFPRGITWAVAGMGALIVLFIFFDPIRSNHPAHAFGSSHSHTQPADDDIIHQTYNNFDGVLQGSLQPEITSEDPQTIRTFLAKTAGFKVQIPAMRDFKLVGAMHSEYNGQEIVQLVYRGTRDIVYLYEVSLQSALRPDHGLRMSYEAISQLQRTGWYVEHHLPDCSLAMWLADSTLCCAVADINKDLLLASLSQQPRQ
jgi:anti-sigma factor (TIGR02949 family)